MSDAARATEALLQSCPLIPLQYRAQIRMALDAFAAEETVSWQQIARHADARAERAEALVGRLRKYIERMLVTVTYATKRDRTVLEAEGRALLAEAEP